MKIATSKITAQGQVSVPLEVRRRLGLAPGSLIEWDAEDDQVTVRRAGRHGFEEIQRALFPAGPPEAKTLEELKEGIRDFVRTKHARH